MIDKYAARASGDRTSQTTKAKVDHKDQKMTSFVTVIDSEKNKIAKTRSVNQIQMLSLDHSDAKVNN